MLELNIRTIFQLLVRNIRWIALSMVIAALLFGSVTVLFVPDTYRSQFQMYVSNYTELTDDQNATTGGLSASQYLVEEYIVVLKNDLIIDEISSILQKQGYTLSNSAIRGMLSMKSENNTAMLNISATSTNPRLTRAVCDAMADVAPGELRRIMHLGTVTVMAPAKNGQKVGPSLSTNVIFGLVLGFALAVFVLIVRELTDNTVSGERDIKQRLGLTVLGEVPSLRQSKKGGVIRGRKK